jgi:fructose-specific component phosphotransferase system IIB-like protein
MGDIRDSAALIYRDYEIDNVPSSGAFKAPKEQIRDLYGNIDDAIVAVGVDAATNAAIAVDAADQATEAAANAATGDLSFATVSAMNAFTTATDNQTAVVAENESEYRWDDGGSAWVFTRLSPNARIAELRASFVPDMPAGSELPLGTIYVMQDDGWIIATLTPTAMNILSANEDWLGEMPGFLQMMPTGGHFVKMQSDGWIITDYDDTSGDAVAVEPTATNAQVAAVLVNEVENQPLLVGKNIFLSVGESTANGIDFMSNAFDQLCTQYATPKPAGATVDDANYFHNAYTVDENIAAWADTKTIIDAAFTAGAECISAITMLEQGNDMVALTDVDYWEERILQWIRMIQNYSRQKYLGTAPAAIMPSPPCFMTVIASWANGDLPLDIPLRSIEMARRIYDFGISTSEYIAEFVDNRHYLNATEQRRIAAWGGIANYEWRINKRKFHPTQVVDAWFDGTAAFLRFEMPKPPLQASTALVSTIAHNGLEAFTAAGVAITITNVNILPNGLVVQVDQASPWVAGDQIWGAITPTTPGTAGRTTGPRSTLCDSSTYTIDLGLGGGPIVFRSHMLPFKRTLTQGTT